MRNRVVGIVGLVLFGLGLAYMIVAVVQYRVGGTGSREWVQAWMSYAATIALLAGAVLSYVSWFRIAYYVTAKELRTYFTSPVAYAIMMAVLGVNGLIFWWILKGFMEGKGQDAGIGPTLMTLTFLLLLIAPMLTMRLLAEEKRSGTYETLMTRPVHDLWVVLGKFVAAVTVMLVILAVTLVNPLIAEWGGNPDWGPVWSAYAGLVGWCMAFAAIGLFMSALTSSQIAAAALAWFAFLMLWLLGFLREISPGKPISKIGEYLSPSGVMDEFCRGTIDTSHVVYLGTLTLFFLFASWMALFVNRSK